jgi:hypothetical protein
MTDTTNSERYHYTYRKGSDPPDRRRSEGAEYETLLSIKQTLILLTGGCEVAARQDGMYCEKHGRTLGKGETRCDYVTERFSKSDGKERTKEEIQRYVSDILGVRDPRMIQRFTG